MQCKIKATTKELRPLKDSQDTETKYTGLLVVKPDGSEGWYNYRGDARGLRGKTVSLEFNGNLCRELKSDGQAALPIEKPKGRLTYEQARQVALDLARDHNEWVTASPRGPEAIAAIIQTFILRLCAGEMEITEDLSPVPGDVAAAYHQTKGWEELT